jgi:hypothetical protein
MPPEAEDRERAEDEERRERERRERVADDLLIGAAAIAKELGIPEHAVYHLTKKRKPTKKKDGRLALPVEPRSNLPIQRWGRTLQHVPVIMVHSQHA